jgi:hypothetical protein
MDKRYLAIIDGCSVNDIAEGESGEVSGETYNYFLFLRPGGSGVIMRERADGFEYRFHAFGILADVDAYWATRTSIVYKRSHLFKAL